MDVDISKIPPKSVMNNSRPDHSPKAGMIGSNMDYKVPNVDMNKLRSLEKIYL